MLLRDNNDELARLHKLLSIPGLSRSNFFCAALSVFDQNEMRTSFPFYSFVNVAPNPVKLASLVNMNGPASILGTPSTDA